MSLGKSRRAEKGTGVVMDLQSKQAETCLLPRGGRVQEEMHSL